MPDESTVTQPTFIVGIGASAGGLEAIERLFDRMPTNTGMAFVVIQHLSPDFKSLMNEVLGRWTSIPIHPVENGMRVAANAIYLIPPKKEMVIVEGRLLLTDKDPEAALTLPIDHFFRSLAQDCGRRAIAIVLSGTGSDGSRGIVDVHEAGGLVIVQSESTAKFDGMPRSARDTGVADFHLAPEEVPETLLQYLSDPRISDVQEPLDNPALNETGLKQVFTLIRDGYGLDFSHYKLNTVVRRTERRLVLSKLQHIDEYVDRLREDRDELGNLYRDLLIGVTRFFRDNEAFENLVSLVIEPLIKEAKDNSEIRVWVPGCATGEEAYSLAILFVEAIAASGRPLQVKIFATDVHKESLEVAAQGVYSEASLTDVDPDLVSKYFTPTNTGYAVSPALRRLIVFAPHNLVRDAPFTKIDLASCRNLLIYLQPSTQRKILSLFHFGLNTGGVLFLGPSEGPGDIGDEFESLNGHWRIFRKRRDVRLRSDARFPLAAATRTIRPPVPSSSETSSGEPLMMSTYDALLELVMPPSLLVSEDGQLLHTFGDAGQFLRPEQGRHTAEVRQRLLQELRLSVTTAIGKVLRDGGTISFSGVQVSRGVRAGEQVSVTARAVPDSRNGTRSVLVQISPQESSETTIPSQSVVGEINSEQVLALESELSLTKENLQSTIEELETSNEELQATNEELVASNEELQSTNEELHSVNEELYTVNAEHQNKIVELSELTRDMDNLLQSTEVDTVFLDAELRIRKFTPRVAKRFNVLPQDTGRRIDDFASSLDCDDLVARIRQVIASGEPHEAEVRDESGDWLLMRILPYRSSTLTGLQHGVEGALLTLVDVTTLREASEALEESVRQRDSFLAMLSHELRNPLATIVNAAHVLATKVNGLEVSDHVPVIQRQARQMTTLLDDLLDVTRVSLGKIQLKKRPFDLMRIVESAIESVLPQCKARGQQVVSQFCESPVWVNGSEPRILQVVTNLLTNASKYSGNGDRIEIEVTSAGGEAAIKVRDQGTGVSAEQVDKIFELFVQADRTLDRADGGLGVGLTLAKALVELHGGRISVHSEGQGRGSEFTVVLPLSDHDPIEQPAPADDTKLPQPRRLALVEDNVDASKMLAFLLEDSGYEVSIAHDGPKALELIRSTDPDIAIIDIGLPGLSGYEVARAVRDELQNDDIYLIALTGYGQPSDRTDALEAGFDEHIVKPVEPDALQRILAAAPTGSNGQRPKLPPPARHRAPNRERADRHEA